MKWLFPSKLETATVHLGFCHSHKWAITSVSRRPRWVCSNVWSSTLKLTHIHKKDSSFLLFLFSFSCAALFGWVGKCVTKCPGKFYLKPQIQIYHVASAWSQLFLMFSPIHMECWAGPGKGRQDSQSLTGALWAGHRALAMPLFVLLTHSHGWQVWCAGFAVLCGSLLAHHGWLHLSRLGPLKVLEIVECPPSRTQRQGRFVKLNSKYQLCLSTPEVSWGGTRHSDPSMFS